MAAVALTTAGVLNVVGTPETQMTAPFAETCAIGQCVRIDTSTGKWTLAKATDTSENRIYGILVSKDQAGAVGTAVRKGVLDGFAVSGKDYDAPLYLSDTDGTVADAAGTVSTVLGRVVPAFNTSLGTAADKLFFVDL